MQDATMRAGGIRLRDVLESAHFLGRADIHVASCCSDSRRCEPGDLFVAVAGSDVDGHDFAADAVRRGAAAVLAEQAVPVTVPVCMVPDTRVAWGEVCQALAGQPTERLLTVGVTGTNGKTTTSYLIASVLAAAGMTPASLTTLGYRDRHGLEGTTRTTPKPPELASWLAAMEARGCDSGVVEVDSRGLARHYLAGAGFDAAVFTGIRRDHLDEHGSVWNYRRIKQRLLSYLKNEGFAVVNHDDPGCRLLLRQLDVPVLTYGLRGPAEVTAKLLERHGAEQTFLLRAGREAVPVRTRMVGNAHIMNCLAAAAVGLVRGIDLPNIVRGLEAVTRVPGRMERLDAGGRRAIYLDCAASPDTLTTALRSIKQVTAGRVYCVYGSDPERDAAQRPLLGRVVEQNAHVGVITATGSSPADSDAVHDILDGYDRPARAHYIPDRGRAILWALEDSAPGDAILIAGHDPAAVLAGEELHHDRSIARGFLRSPEPDEAAAQWN